MAISSVSSPCKAARNTFFGFSGVIPKADDQEVWKMFKNLLPDSQKILKA
jgi:hypothetical protein